LSNSVEVLFPSNRKESIADIVKRVSASKASQKFLSDDMVAFIAAFSRAIFRNKSFRMHPELISLASWCRSKRIEGLIQEYSKVDRTLYLREKGIAFHIAPSNVDTIFVYSLFISLLAGNKNIIKVSSRNSEVIIQIIKVFFEVVAREPHFNFIKDYITVIQYENQKDITDKISFTADLRVIWGGDESILNIRKSPLRPTASEVAFPNRFSFSILDSSSYLELIEDDKSQLVDKFVADASTFGQQACSSPRLLFWLGSEIETKSACEDFSSRIQRISLTDDFFDMTERLVSVTNFVARNESEVTGLRASFCNLKAPLSKEMIQSLRECHTGNNWLLHVSASSVTDLNEYLTHKDQTASYFGLSREDISNFLNSIEGRAIDRVVPIGSALNFDHVWDGHDLLMSFSRQVRVQK
jgi:hypothetical protein